MNQLACSLAIPRSSKLTGVRSGWVGRGGCNKHETGARVRKSAQAPGGGSARGAGVQRLPPPPSAFCRSSGVAVQAPPLHLLGARTPLLHTTPAPPSPPCPPPLLPWLLLVSAWGEAGECAGDGGQARSVRSNAAHRAQRPCAAAAPLTRATPPHHPSPPSSTHPPTASTERAMADEAPTPPRARLAQLLAASRDYAASGAHRALPLGVSRRLVVLTCMDSRRGGGGRAGRAQTARASPPLVATRSIPPSLHPPPPPRPPHTHTYAHRSLLVCQEVLRCDTVVVIHHTDWQARASLCMRVCRRGGPGGPWPATHQHAE